MKRTKVITEVHLNYIREQMRIQDDFEAVRLPRWLVLKLVDEYRRLCAGKDNRETPQG